MRKHLCLTAILFYIFSREGGGGDFSFRLNVNVQSVVECQYYRCQVSFAAVVRARHTKLPPPPPALRDDRPCVVNSEVS